MKLQYMILGLLLLPLFSQIALADSNSCTVGTAKCLYINPTSTFVTPNNEIISCNSNTGQWCPSGQSISGCANSRPCRDGCFTGLNNVPYCGEDSNVCQHCTPNSKWCEGSTSFTCQWSSIASCWVKGFDTDHAILCQYGCTNGVCNQAPPVPCQSECTSTQSSACRTGLDGVPDGTETYCAQQSNGCYKYDINDNRDKVCAYGCSGSDGSGRCNAQPVVCKDNCALGSTTSDGTYIYTCIADRTTNGTCNKFCTNPSDCINWYKDPTTGANKSGIIKCDTGVFYNRDDNQYECDTYFSEKYNTNIKGFAQTYPTSFDTNLAILFPNESNVGQTEAWVAGGFKYFQNTTVAYTIPTLSIGEINSISGLTENKYVYSFPDIWNSNQTYGMFYDNNYLWVEMGVATTHWYAFNPVTMEYKNLQFDTTIKPAGNPVWLNDKIYFSGGGQFSNRTYIMDYSSVLGIYVASSPSYFVINGDGQTSIDQLINDGTSWWGIGSPCQIPSSVCLPNFVQNIYKFSGNWSIESKYQRDLFAKNSILPAATTDDLKYFIGANMTSRSGTTLLSVFLIDKNGNVLGESCPSATRGNNGQITYASRCAGAVYVDQTTGRSFPGVYTEIQYCTQNTQTGQWQWNADPTMGSSCPLGCQKSSTNLYQIGTQYYYFVPTQCSTTKPIFACPNDCTRVGDYKCENGYIKTCQDLFSLTSGKQCFGWLQNSTQCPSGRCDPKGKTCSLGDECRIGENYCVSFGQGGQGLDFVQNCFYDKNVGANRLCQESSGRCNLTQCTQNQICYQSFNQTSSFTTAECADIGYKDLQATGNWLAEAGIGFDKHSQIGILAINDFGRALFFIVLAVILLIFGFWVSHEIWGGVGLASMALLMGVMAGWLPPIIIVLIIIGLGYALSKMFFSTGGGE